RVGVTARDQRADRADAVLGTRGLATGRNPQRQRRDDEQRRHTRCTPSEFLTSRHAKLGPVTPRVTPNFLEGRRRDYVAARHAYDGEGLVERRYDLIVLVKWRIRDIDHVVGLHAKLLGHEDRHRLVEVQPEHPSPRPRVLQVAHAEDENAGIDLRGPAVWHAGPR